MLYRGFCESGAQIKRTPMYTHTPTNPKRHYIIPHTIL